MTIVGKIIAINTSDGMYNIQVNTKSEDVMNLKININDANGINIGKVYEFEYETIINERTSYLITSFKSIDEFGFDEKNSALRKFYQSAPLSYDEAKSEIDKYLSYIDNKNIKAICEYLINKYHDEFFIYPAAAKMHHAYVGGLAHHSVGMLRLAESLIYNYPYLDKNYLYAGVMLHDIGKTVELTGPIDTAYSIEGQLLGHLVLGAMEIKEAAKALGICEDKDVLILEHMLISHHGQPQFGSAKRPMTAEALMLWYIDTIDSKFRTLGDELESTESGNYTNTIGVLDKIKIYKP